MMNSNTVGGNSLDPDQLASFISGYILFLNESIHVYCLSIFRAKLSSLCIICSLGQVKISLDKYLTAIYVPGQV